MISAMRDIVLIKRQESKKKTDSGLFLPVEAQEASDQGIVQSVGKKVVDIKTGDKVLFESRAAYEVKSEGSDMIMMRQHHILAVIDKDAKVQTFNTWKME